MPRLALSALFAVIIPVAFTAPIRAARAAEASQLPSQQLHYSESGVRFAFKSLVFGVKSMIGPLTKLTLMIENDREDPVGIVATNGPSSSSNPPLAVINDGRGGVCDNVNNVSAISTGRRSSRLKHDMTTVPGRSRIYVTFAFESCKISRADLSFMGWFAVSTNNGKVEFLTVPLWGIEASSGQ